MSKKIRPLTWLKIYALFVLCVVLLYGFTQRSAAQNSAAPLVIGVWATGEDAFVLHYLRGNVYLEHHRHGVASAIDSFSVHCPAESISAVAEGAYVNVFVACPEWIDGRRFVVPVQLLTAQRHFIVYLPLVER